MNTVASLYRCLIGTSFSRAIRPGVDGSIWSTEMQDPGPVMGGMDQLLDGVLVRQGREHNGVFALSSDFGRSPLFAIWRSFLKKMWPSSP